MIWPFKTFRDVCSEDPRNAGFHSKLLVTVPYQEISLITWEFCMSREFVIALLRLVFNNKVNEKSGSLASTGCG